MNQSRKTTKVAFRAKKQEIHSESPLISADNSCNKRNFIRLKAHGWLPQYVSVTESGKHPARVSFSGTWRHDILNILFYCGRYIHLSIYGKPRSIEDISGFGQALECPWQIVSGFRLFIEKHTTLDSLLMYQCRFAWEPGY